MPTKSWLYGSINGKLNDRLNRLQFRIHNTLINRLRKEPMQQIFIDKFTVPTNSWTEFFNRMNINRDFIKKLPGFVRDNVYKRNDDNGNFICITVAVWENEEAINNAKESVQIEYKRTGFNPAEMFARLNISIERGTYNEVDN